MSFLELEHMNKAIKREYIIRKTILLVSQIVNLNITDDCVGTWQLIIEVKTIILPPNKSKHEKKHNGDSNMSINLHPNHLSFTNANDLTYVFPSWGWTRDLSYANEKFFFLLTWVKLFGV